MLPADLRARVRTAPFGGPGRFGSATPGYGNQRHIVYAHEGKPSLAEVYHEWRDWTSEVYRAGPNLTIRTGHLSASATDRCDPPADQWVRFETPCEIGGSPERRRRLRFTMPDGTARLFDGLPFAGPGSRKLTWLGFCSTGDEAAGVYLSDLSLTGR